MKTNRPYRRIGAGIFMLTALGIYLAANARGVYPGESAAIMARALGASPFPPLSQPLWEALSRAVGYLAPAALVLPALSVLCAVGAAVSVGLVFSIAWRLAGLRGLGRTMEPLRGRTSSSSRDEAPLIVSVAAGLWASILLMLNLPVLMAATRPMPAAFDLCLLMFTLHRLVVAAQSGRRRDHGLAALLMGLLIVENPASLPIIAVAVIWMAWVVIQQGLVTLPGLTGSANQDTNISLVWVCAGLFIMGAMAPLMLKAAALHLTSAGLWYGYDSWWKAVWGLITFGYRQYNAAWPSQGWLIMASVSLGPAALIAFVAHGADHQPVARTLAFLLLPVAVAGALALNSPVTPWMLLERSPSSIWPGAILSLWAGALGALWARFSWIKWTIWERRFPAKPQPVPILWRWCVAWGVPLVLWATAIAGTAREWTWVDSRGVDALRETAASVVRDVPPRTWILSSGWMDDLMALSIYEQKLNVCSLDVLKIQQGHVQRYLLHEWRENSLVSGLAGFNMDAALLEWLNGEGHSCAAIMDAPFVWPKAGLVAMPETWMYSGLKGPPSADVVKASSASSFEKMRELQPLAARLQTLPPTLKQYGKFLRLLLSRISNDHGVQMISAGIPERAKEWFELAKNFCPENDIPIWNLILLSASDEHRSDIASALMEQMRGTDAPRRAFLAQGGWLSPQFSAVKAPASDRPSLGRELTPAQRMDLALQAGATHSMASLSEFLESKNAMDDAVMAASGVISLISSGKLPEAEKALEGLRKQFPTDPLCSLTELLMLAMSQRANEAVRVESELEARKIALPASISVALAYMEVRHKMERKAVARLEEAIRSNPGYLPAMEMRLMLAVQQSDRAAADRWAERIIALDRGHPVALQVMAMIMAERHQWNESEGLLRKALERGVRPDLLNDLAWTLAMSGRASEAEPLIRDAVRQVPVNPTFVDTLVEVLSRMNRQADALKALEDGLRQWPSDPRLLKRKAEMSGVRSS